ncbi:ABC transporter A family protein [Pelomyxa schiedti]|nr:ABC transporter A family protein [Pelomyxa schiedti]
MTENNASSLGDKYWGTDTGDAGATQSETESLMGAESGLKRTYGNANRGKYVLLKQLRAMFLKNVTLSVRQRKQLAVQIILPLTITLGIGLAALLKGDEESHSLNDWMYKDILYYPSDDYSYGDHFFYVDPNDVAGHCYNASYNYDNPPRVCGDTLYSGGILGTYYQRPWTEAYWCDDMDQYVTLHSCSPFFEEQNDWDTALEKYMDLYKDARDANNDWDMSYCKSAQIEFQMPQSAFYFEELTSTEEISLPDVKLHYRVFATNQYLAVAWNYDTYDPVMISINSIDSAFLRLITNYSYSVVVGETKALDIVLGFSHFPEHFYLESPRAIILAFEAILVPFILMCLMPFFMQKVVVERNSGLSEMLNLAGLNTQIYWIGNFLCDCLIYSIFLLILIPLGAVLQMKIYTEVGISLYCLIISWGIALIGLSYFFAVFVRTAAQSAVVGFIIVCLQLAAAVLLIYFVYYDQDGTPAYFMLYPPFALAWGFFVTGHPLSSKLEMFVCPDVSVEQTWRATGWVAGMGLIFLLVSSYLDQVMPRAIGMRKPFYFPITDFIFWVSHKLGTKKGRKFPATELAFQGDKAELEPEDEDVRRERHAVYELSGASDCPLVIKAMSKTFSGGIGTSNVQALKNVTFHVEPGQCFGLLGPNGAGKTTLLNILCGLMSPTGGSAVIGGCALENLSSMRRMIGLCPQFDWLFDDLTTQEHLLFYTRLKGFPIRKESAHVESIIKEVSLQNERRRLSRDLSGGQKRRLSFAIALTNDPAVVFLDEPTSGLDPGCTRELWNVITTARQNRCFLLTTHSMAEAETVCTQIGILSRGHLKCIGTPQHLKSRFGQGYKLEVLCESSEEATKQEAHNFVASIIKGEPQVLHGTTHSLVFQIPHTVRVSDMFEVLSRESKHHKIKSWSVGQSNLEEVFIAIVHQDEGEAETAAPSTLPIGSIQDSSLASSPTSTNGSL